MLSRNKNSLIAQVIRWVIPSICPTPARKNQSGDRGFAGKPEGFLECKGSGHAACVQTLWCAVVRTSRQTGLRDRLAVGYTA